MSYFLMKRVVSFVVISVCLFACGTWARAEDSALDHIVDGVEAFESADYQDAAVSLKKALELEPENLDALYYLGLVYGAQGMYSESLSLLKTVLNRDSAKFYKAYFDIAGLYSRQRLYDKAVETLSLAEAIKPNSTRVHFEMGYAYKNLGEYGQAISHFKRAGELDKTLLQMVFYDTGTVYMDAEQFDDAEAAFTRAIDIAPDMAVAQNARNALAAVKAQKKRRKPWFLTTSFSWTYDDNVPLEPLESVLPTPSALTATDKEDDYQTLLLNGGYKFVNRKDLEIGAGYTLYCVGYHEYTENNLLAHIPHAFLSYNASPFFFRMEYNFNYFYAGGDSDKADLMYLAFGSKSESKLRMHSIVPTLTILEPHNLRSDILATYQSKEYLDGVTSNANTYLGGIIQSYTHPKTRWTPRIGYKFGYEDADDEESSYRYHEGVIGVSGPLPWNLNGDVSLSKVKTFYQNFPGNGDRRDRSYIAAVTLTKSLIDMVQLQLTYNFIKNNSNRSLNGNDPNKFEKNVFMFNVTASF